MSGPVDSLKKLALEKFQQLVSRGTILEEDGHGIKVLQLPDGTIAKAFRLKHIFSSALISPRLPLC